MQGINTFLEELKENTPLEIVLPEECTTTAAVVRGVYSGAIQTPISVILDVSDIRIKVPNGEWTRTGRENSIKLSKSEFFDKVKVLKDLNE